MNAQLALQILGGLLNRVPVTPAEQFAVQSAMDYLYNATKPAEPAKPVEKDHG